MSACYVEVSLARSLEAVTTRIENTMIAEREERTIPQGAASASRSRRTPRPIRGLANSGVLLRQVACANGGAEGGCFPRGQGRGRGSCSVKTAGKRSRRSRRLHGPRARPHAPSTVGAAPNGAGDVQVQGLVRGFLRDRRGRLSGPRAGSPDPAPTGSRCVRPTRGRANGWCRSRNLGPWHVRTRRVVVPQLGQRRTTLMGAPPLWLQSHRPVQAAERLR